MHPYNRLPSSPPPSPLRSPRLRPTRSKTAPKPSPRTFPQRLSYLFLSGLLRRQGIFLFAPLIYICCMLLYFGSFSFDVVPIIKHRSAPGSVYRSPQLYAKLKFEMDEDNSSVDAISTIWKSPYKGGEWKPCVHSSEGVVHHLLGSVNPNLEFTAKTFRDSAIPIIDAILSRNHLPVIVGGTNYYIQALVSQFLLDDSTDDLSESYLGGSPGITGYDHNFVAENDSSSNSYDLLKDIDPVAANRIHPNNHRKINQYISLYSRTGVLPSKIFQGQAAEKWGQADNLRYDCCFISVDASLPVLDRYVEQRVDDMMYAGLLNEVYEIYTMNADYTRGLRQAIGVREFEDLLRTSVFKGINRSEGELIDGSSLENSEPLFDGNLMEWLRSSSDTKSTTLLEEAIKKVKVNTRRLVRRQKRMLSRLETLFGWDIHYVDSTESILSKSNDVWNRQVAESARKIVTTFLSENGSLSSAYGMSNGTGTKIIQRDLWTQYTCKACSDRVLRGLHEWEQHIRGRGHRKRISSLKSKAKGLCFVEKKCEPSEHECSDML